MKRLTHIAEIRNKLKNNIPSIGSWMQIPNASVAEIMGHAQYDWVAVDLEHGAIAVHQLPDLFRALALGGTLPLARIAQGHPKDCKQALDAGAGGVIIPMVDNAAMLHTIRDACCWPPAGSRGVGFSRANLFGKYFDAYVDEAQAPLVIAMIEHIDAVHHLPEILKVPGLDAILIGPYDLSASMHLTAQFDHPLVQSTIAQIRECASAAGVACGIHIVKPDVAQLQQSIHLGYRFLAYSIDAVFLNESVANPYQLIDSHL